MKNSAVNHLVIVIALLISSFTCVRPVHADSLNITYFTIAENDKDANHLAGGLFTNEVQSTLGVNGLPILNTSAYGCVSGCYAAAGAPTDVLADGEITYWNASLNNGGSGGSSDVTQTGTGTVSIPYTNNSFFRRTGRDRVIPMGFRQHS